MNINKLMSNSAAVVVAAGLSSRMKKFKPMLPLEQDTIIRQLITTLQKSGVAPIVVVVGREADKLSEHIADLNITIVENKQYAETDMFCSACLGFAAIKDSSERVFFLPADVPLFSHYSVISMKEYMDETPCDVLIPTYGTKHGHPILIKSAILPELMASDSKDGLRGAIKSCNAHTERLSLPDKGLIMDADTPEQYLLLQEYEKTAAMRVPVGAKIKINVGKEMMFFDADFARLLELADKHNSLTKACQQAKTSYSNAWKNIKLAEEQLGFIILQSNRGGAGGGGSKLTRQGKAFVAQYKKFAKSIEKYSQKQFCKYFTEDQ